MLLIPSAFRRETGPGPGSTAVGDHVGTLGAASFFCLFVFGFVLRWVFLSCSPGAAAAAAGCVGCVFLLLFSLKGGIPSELGSKNS